MVKKQGGWAIALLAAVLVLVGYFYRPEADAQQETPGGFQDYSARSQTPPAVVARPLEVPKMYAFERLLENGVRQVVLVDSETKRICVYHIDPQGKIEFVANRNFEWDLKMEDFNGTGLTPNEIREAVGRSSGTN